MFKLPRSAPAIAIVAAVAVLSATGGAVAATMITSSQIKDNTIRSIDVRNGTLKTVDLSAAARAALAGANGTNGTNGTDGAIGPAGATGPVGPAGPLGPAGPAGQAGPAGAIGATGPAGTNGTNGTNGAPGLVRGYGTVSATGAITKQSGGITVTHPAAGQFCIMVPGVSPATSVAVVSADFNGNATNTLSGDQSVIETHSLNCAGPAFRVVTLVRTAAGNSLAFVDQPFTFLIP